MVSFKTIFSATCFLLVSCQPADDVTSYLNDAQHSQFDVNDVSILYPLPEKEEDLAALISLDQGNILSAENFSRLIDKVKPAEFRYDYRETWRIVAVRFDPCRQSIPGVSPCQRQFRLVVQPTYFFYGECEADDHAFHLIYEHDEHESRNIARRLFKLKSSEPRIDTIGMPLGIHPIMSEQGLNGVFARGLSGLILEMAREEHLVEATAMILEGASHWRFARTTMVNGKLAPTQIPFAAGDTQTFFSERSKPFSQIFVSEIIPHGSGRDNMNIMVDETKFKALKKRDQELARDAALRIDNPDIHSPDTVDCVSCHLASRSLAQYFGREILTATDGNPFRFARPLGVTSENLADDMDLFSPYSVRNFGYGLFVRRKIPAITQRVINESAKVAAYLNEHRLHLQGSDQ